MPILDQVKKFLFVQDEVAAPETKAALVPQVLSIAPTNTASTVLPYRVINNLGFNQNSQPDNNLNVVFLAILNRIQTAAKSVEWNVYKLKGDETRKKMPDSNFANLIYRPNVKQSWSDFVSLYLVRLLSTGNVFIYCPRNANGINVGQAAELRIMPSTTEVIGGTDWLSQPTGYKVPRPQGGYNVFTPDEVLHIKRFTLSDDDTYGLSPVAAAAYQLTNITLATKQRIQQMANGGPAVVMYNQEEKADPFTEDQEQAFVRKVSGPTKFTYVNGKFGTSTIGLSPVDLDILNSIKADSGMVADLLAFPSILLSNTDGNTFSNVEAATKALYNDCVLPFLWELKDGINNKLGKSYGDKLFLDLDVSAIDALKPNLAAIITAANSANYLTVNEKLVMTGLPTVDGGNVYLLANTMRIVGDLTPTPVAAEATAAEDAAVGKETEDDQETGKKRAEPAA